MAIEKEKFFEIIRNVSESEGLNKDNLLQKIKGELHQKDYAEYDKFKRNFSKEHQFSIKISDKIEDWTLLHLAAACNNLLTVELLLKKKASVKTRVKDGSNDGPTALDIAKSNGNQEIVQLLSDANANPKLEKNEDKTSRDIITKANEIPEDLVVNRNNAAAALENGNKQTSFNSTDESSDSTVDEQRQSVKDMIKNFESPQRRNTTCSGKQTSISLNESGNSDDSGICTESEDGEDIDAKNEELKKLEKELAESKSCIAEHETTLEALKKQNQKESESLEQQIQDLESKNTTLEGGLGKAQKELTELKNCVTGQGTRLEALNKLNEENQSLKQKIKSLENENTPLKGELGKTKTSEVSLGKAHKVLAELKDDVAGHEARLEALNKLNEENQSLKQKMQVLESENATLNSELEKTQKELEESKSCIAEYETKLKEFNKENESLKQKIKSLENENTPLKGELGKTKTNEVSRTNSSELRTTRMIS